MLDGKRGVGAGVQQPTVPCAVRAHLLIGCVQVAMGVKPCLWLQMRNYSGDVEDA